MSDALHHALDKIGRALERGVQEAELELADARERCRWLETEVRSLRAAVRPVIPEVAPLLFRPTVADAEEQPVVIEHPALARAQELSLVLTPSSWHPNARNLTLSRRPVRSSKVRTRGRRATCPCWKSSGVSRGGTDRPSTADLRALWSCSTSRPGAGRLRLAGDLRLALATGGSSSGIRYRFEAVGTPLQMGEGALGVGGWRR